MAEPKPRARRSDERTDGPRPRPRRERADAQGGDGESEASPRRKKATKKATAPPEGRRRAEQRDSPPDRSSGSRSPRRRPASSTDARQAAAAAAGYVRELTGSRPEGLTSLEQTDDGWRIGVEVLESRRIPDSTDILAEYRVDLDEDGALVSYRRERRYHRGRVEGDHE